MMNYGFLKNRAPRLIGEGEIQDCAVGIVLPGGAPVEEILFEVRSVKIHHQPGDICLPGGSVEPGETPEQAVVREISEELLVSPSQVRVIGPADILVSGNMLVHPFLCRLEGYEDTFSTDEVAEVFRVPLSFFLETEPAIHEVAWKAEPAADFPYEGIAGGKNYHWRTRRNRIRFYGYGGRVIWGLTARIMESFAELCRKEGGEA